MNTPERVGGRYRLDELLARGGMASVYQGRDERLDRPVAVKLLRDDVSEEASVRRRFKAEARRAASIAHPHVVAIYDVGTTGGTPYIVMELMAGGDLADALAAERPMDPRRAARIGAEVADALAAAHAAGVVHRDVKPRNILLDAAGGARVADFGIARATGDESLTRTGAMLGSVEYFSPEQARGERATPSSDLYALGIVLFELVTGQRPFTGDTPYSVATARLRRPPPDPRIMNDTVPDGLAAIIRRAMAAAPEDRYASAAELRDALLAWLEAPLPGRRAPRGVAAAAPVGATRGHRTAFHWLAVAGVLALLVAGYVGWRALAGDSAAPVGNPIDVIAGPPGGEVTTPSASPSPVPTPTATPVPPTASPTPPEPSPPEPTEAVAAGTPAPPAPTDAPAATSVAVAIAGPDDAVAAFYRRVVDGDFDAAYALWSDRMKATYPRQENLDDRFADTASISFFELRVASQSESAATVQANFTERYDGGGSRDFIGYWRLVRVDGGWLLDEPNY